MSKNLQVKSFIKIPFFISISALIFSCAQVVSPTGGAKDETPPKMTKSIPANNSTNFSSKSIRINFNEYISLKDLNSQLIISPPLKKIPDVVVKGKSLSMEIKDTLKPNTTYTFSFGNSIVDFTENNPIDNFQYTFSTGSFLDSLSLSGKVDKAFNHTTEKGILVMLYGAEKAKPDSFPYHQLPDYFGKTNELGNYSIKNVRNGKYKVFALKDGNSNYLFDSDEEQIAFSDSLIDIEKSATLDLTSFQELKSKLYLKKPVRSTYAQLICAFSKPTNNITFEPLNPSQKIAWSAIETSPHKDTVNLWFAGVTQDSLRLKVFENNIIIDTLEVKIPKLIKDKNSEKGRGPGLYARTNINDDGSFDINKKIRLQFSQPVKTFATSTIFIIARKDTLKLITHFTDSIKRNFEITAPLKEDSLYSLLILPGSFEDYNGLKNDTLKFSLRVLPSRVYGTLKLVLKLPEGKNYILQMLDEKENSVNEKYFTKSEVIQYEYLKPQVYKLKIIEDLNGNKQWDTGNFLKQLQPEKTFYYAQPLTIRANWDLQEEWNLTK